MAIKITDECINCNQCLAECPNTAIYEEGALWSMAEGTNLKDQVETINGSVDAEAEQEPIGIGMDYFYIAPDKCTECIGFNPEPACAAVCPMDCCVPDEDHEESQKELEAKKKRLHDE